MTKFRLFIIKQFCIASALKLGKHQLNYNKCTLWGFPSLVLSALMCGYSYQDINLIFYLMFVPLAVSLAYLYFVFLHFRIFPITESEAITLIEEGVMDSRVLQFYKWNERLENKK